RQPGNAGPRTDHRVGRIIRAAPSRDVSQVTVTSIMPRKHAWRLESDCHLLPTCWPLQQVFSLFFVPAWELIPWPVPGSAAIPGGILDASKMLALPGKGMK